MNIENIYTWEERHSEDSFMFFFMSEGKSDLIKAIQFRALEKVSFPEGHPMYDREIYNLGFGDYNPDDDTINDSEVSNNGDPYKVFNTVLSTIPPFFESNHGKVIMVSGSDSRAEFVDKCKETCKKNCSGSCKNFNRRINIYKRYIDKNHDSLSIDYQFFGGMRTELGRIIIQEYDKNQKYDLIFLLKK